MENKTNQTEKNSNPKIKAELTSDQSDEYNPGVDHNISSDQTSPATCRADIDE